MARQDTTPTFIVADFSERPRRLFEMATFLPQNRDEMRKISGVGEMKLQKYADEFQIVGYLSKEQPHILLVDDNAVNRKVASEILLKAGCRVETADSGRKAIQLVKQTIGTDPYSLILMDIQLPIMDGYETTRRLKADPALHSIPIIAITSYALGEDEKRARAAGCDDFVAKPYSPRSLLAKIRQYLV